MSNKVMKIEELNSVADQLTNVDGLSGDRLMNCLKLESEISKRLSASRKIKILVKAAPVSVSTPLEEVAAHAKLFRKVLTALAKKNEAEQKKPTACKKALDEFLKKIQDFNAKTDGQYQEDVMIAARDFSIAWFEERDKICPLKGKKEGETK
jgi:hypothetical protein